MYKIRKITFLDNPVLNNLSIDFCNMDGNAAETIIIAGENGAGKSTVINELYKVVTHEATTPLIIEFENNGRVFSITYYT